MPDHPFTVHVVCHTHWDREWYLSRSGFRPKLVKAIDRLLKIFDQYPGYIFHLDGQTVLLEDYLEVRPQNEERLRKYAAEGRLIIGPWYTMPDEFLPGLESLYRNLKLGIKSGRRFGPVMKVGYLPDPFGHTGQMWQMLRKFDIKWAIFKRGMPLPPDAVRSEVRLVSPDGSSVLGAYLVHGYTNAKSLGTVNRPVSWLCRGLMALLTSFVSSDQKPDGWRDWAYYFLSFPAIFWLTQLLVGIDDAARRPGLVETEAQSLHTFTDSQHVLFMSGGDHSSPRADATPMIERANAGQMAYRLKSGTIEGYFEAIGDRTDLPVIAGEMRSGRYEALLPGVLSARMYLKQANRRIEDLAEKWAFPWASVAALAVKKAYPAADLERASRLLIMNHAHDSICGTGVDTVHVEMMGRFRQAESVFEGVAFDSLEAVARRVNTGTIGDGETGLLVFNPSGIARSGVILHRTVCEPASRAVRDAAGRAVPAQVERDGVYFLTDVPALGYRLYRVVAGSPAAPTGGVTASERHLENEYLAVDVSSDGAFTVRHKASGRSLGPLGYFEDGGDAGDTYNYAPPEADKVLTTLGNGAEISLLSRGPLEATVRISVTFGLPRRLDVRGGRRVGGPVSTRLVSTLTLATRSPVLRVRTEVDNRVRDHRLRVLFPSGIKCDTCHADGQWEVVERQIAAEPPLDVRALEATGRRIGTMPGAESPVATQPHRRFIDVSDGQTGLAVISHGLPEYEVRADAQRTIALTLLRCVGWLSRSTLATRRGLAGPVLRVPGAQCQGQYSFEYAVMPHQGGWEQAGVPAAAESQNVPFRMLAVTSHAGSLPAEHSFISVAPSHVEVSGVEMSDTGRLLVRMCNLAGQRAGGELACGFAVNGAAVVDFNETVLKTLAVRKNSVSFEIGPHEVVMLSLGV